MVVGEKGGKGVGIPPNPLPLYNDALVLVVGVTNGVFTYMFVNSDVSSLEAL
jgi:hypothetical protein